MAKINYVVGDATCPQGPGVKLIVHICNDVGAWGAGFVLALSKRWKDPEADYREWARRKLVTPFELGQVRFVPVEEQEHCTSIIVANLIGQQGLKGTCEEPPIRYMAVRLGLLRIRHHMICLYENSGWKSSVHMPRIGCGLAGGEWSRMAPIIQEELVDEGINVTVYDLPK